ncbi:2792_t:CDS:2 [Diversispora eburnea]|uniref:2792_t:CDS:1 n=1 Tax=Diversispora eburnea TaxID=1213867 RepID=A0A9N9FRP1_9GLOM|nr:2792_t:CDS:2 [Diversispora eburnea]
MLLRLNKKLTCKLVKTSNFSQAGQRTLFLKACTQLAQKIWNSNTFQSTTVLPLQESFPKIEHVLPHALIEKNTEFVHVFIDNSNIFIEGKYSIAESEHLGTYDIIRRKRCLNNFHIDYGQLLVTILNGRKLGGTPIIFGSHPLPNDTLWRRAREQGYTVQVYERNSRNQEKIVDIALAYAMSEAILTKDPGTLVLVSGDGNYLPVINSAIKHKWMVETWFWIKGISTVLWKESHFNPLELYYKSFTYIHESDQRDYVLEINDSKIIKTWGHDELMECFTISNLFAMWNWTNKETRCFNTVKIRSYLDNGAQDVSEITVNEILTCIIDGEEVQHARADIRIEMYQTNIA